jgi:hypothetical protein
MIHGLQQIIYRVQCTGSTGMFFVSTDEHDKRLPVLEEFQDSETIDFRHVYVEESDIRMQCLDQMKRFFAALRFGYDFNF